MSAPQLDTDTDGAEQTEEPLAEQLGIHPDYEPVLMEPVSGYGPLIDAWVRMKYPLNVSQNFEAQHGIIECGNWRHAKQFPDGRGIYRSGPNGGQTLAIRTAERIVVWNNYHGDPWPYDAEAKDAVAAEFEVPYGFVGALLTEQTDLDRNDENSILARGRGEDSWVDGDLWMQGVVHADVMEGEDSGVLLEHDDGSQVYVGLDETAHDHPMFGFVPFDGEEGIRVPSARDALDLLRPDEALSAEKRQGEWFFVDSDETHAKAKGTIQRPGVGERDWVFEHSRFPDLGPFATRHEAIGAVTTAVNDEMRERLERKDHADHPGEADRQHVTIFADRLIGVEPTRSYTSGSPLESHIPRDWKTRCRDMDFIRRVIEELVKGDADPHRDEYDRLSDLNGLEHADFEEIGVFWQDSPQDVFDKMEAGEIDLDYARARELAGGIYVRGTVRHRRGEHTMLSLDGWHQPATHGREVLVLEPDGRAANGVNVSVHVDY